MATFLCFSNVLLKQGFLYSEYFKGLILRKVSRLMKHYLRYKRKEVKAPLSATRSRREPRPLGDGMILTRQP